MNLLPLKQRRSALFTLVSVLAAAYAAPYLVPDSPDSLVFRDGVLPALLLLYRRERRWALCTLPVWGIILSLLFSACILIRYSYPFMVCVPMLALLILFSNRRPA